MPCFCFSIRSLSANFTAPVERQTTELTKAIQIGVEEVTGSGTTDEARLSKYLTSLNAKGVKEISIISNAHEIVASTNPSKIGQPMTHKKKELIIKAELGEPVSAEEGHTYNVIVPVVAGNTQYGYVHLRVNRDDFSDMLRENTIKRILATVFVFGVGIIMIVLFSQEVYSSYPARSGCINEGCCRRPQSEYSCSEQ